MAKAEKSKGISDHSGFHIYGWMINNGGLYGEKLLLFAHIYSYSKDNNGKFYGSLEYLMATLKCSKNTVLKHFRELIDLGLIIKKEERFNNIIFHSYTHNEQVVQILVNGGSISDFKDDLSVQNLGVDGSNFEHNNIIDNNSNTNKEKEYKKEVSVSRPIYRKFKHLTLYQDEFEKLNADYKVEQIDSILDDIENFKKNTNYTSLYLTAKKWLKMPQNTFNQKTTKTDEQRQINELGANLIMFGDEDGRKY